MEEQQKREIIKALSFDVPIERIAEETGVNTVEIEQIAYDFADKVAREKEYNKTKRG